MIKSHYHKILHAYIQEKMSIYKQKNYICRNGSPVSDVKSIYDAKYL